MYFGVTMLGFPVMSEQHTVAYRLEQNGISKKAKDDATPSELLDTIKSLITDDGPA